MSEYNLRNLKHEDCEVISSAFTQQGWNKPREQYENYLKEQSEGLRDIIVAEYNNDFAGYITIVWKSSYPYFIERYIPEIMDFNVLIKYRRKHIGYMLMNEAEKRIKEKSDIAGIRVGLISDYGAAQILYVKRGYIPDGLGLYYRENQMKYGDKLNVDDDLTIGFTKML